jgi:hypothetical protein
MYMFVRIVFSSALVGAGIALFVRPQIVDWVSDRTNLRTARWWARRGFPQYAHRYDENVKILHAVVPVLLVVVGIAILVVGP